MEKLTSNGLADVTAVILAGGLGTRLRSVVADRPKVLAEVHGRPFLAYLLDQLAAAGIRYVVLCTGYLGEQVEAVFGHSYRDMDIVYSQESLPLGTAGALRLACPFFKSDTVLVMNGDSFCDADLAAFWNWHGEQRVPATLLLTQVPDTTRYGRVQVGANGRIVSFVEKGHTSGRGWINAGIYLFTRHLLQTIPPGRSVSIEKESFPRWIDQGLSGYQSEGRFIDIGTPESYARAEAFFASKNKRLLSVKVG